MSGNCVPFSLSGDRFVALPVPWIPVQEAAVHVRNVFHASKKELTLKCASTATHAENHKVFCLAIITLLS